MQQDNKWTSPPDTPRNFMSLQSGYTYGSNEYPSSNNSTVLPGLSSQPPMPGMMSSSQPGTPRPDIISPPPDKIATTPDLIRRRPPLPSRPASFTTTTFHSNPYPTNVSLRRRRTESSMFSFETGPSFSSTKQMLDLWNMDQSNSYQVNVNAKMDRGFFRADQDWTCYRRNYFQVSATFDVTGMNYALQGPEVPCLVGTENQEIHQVDFFSIGVSARVAGSDKKIELVQHTPKRDKGPQMVPEPRVVNAGGNLHLASVGSNHNIVTFERMQFKTATANNGKRRAAQQYYEIVIDLCANTPTGKQFKVATINSAPLVVRGRSPGHYADSHTRYRSMDAGQPSSAPFGMMGGPNPTSSTSTPNVPPPPPPPPSSSAAAAVPSGPSAGVNQDDHYMQSPQSARFNVNPPSGNHDFGNPYSSYPPPPPPSQQTSGYAPYSVGGYGPVMNNPHVNRNDEDGSQRQGGNPNSNNYMMHPYAAHSLSHSSQPQQHPHPPSSQHNSQGDSYYNSTNNDMYNNQQDNKYWSREHMQPHPDQHNRYNGSNNTNNNNYEFGYSMRPHPTNSNAPPPNTTMDPNPLDAGRR
ncbi:Transcription factor vib-1 [Choanephora cucurbitarum]|uniref:Transcription factor vib-1 n=1 Tax=Choanephora cucurbitarum TaxID=101091 RepID=A0A1C7N019_9FUNG|nr:Transcription factor vib-1 [Choanephora cucurbitarum]